LIADKHWLMLAMMGMPPATAASKAMHMSRGAGSIEQLGAVFGK